MCNNVFYAELFLELKNNVLLPRLFCPGGGMVDALHSGCSNRTVVQVQLLFRVLLKQIF